MVADPLEIVLKAMALALLAGLPALAVAAPEPIYKARVTGAQLVRDMLAEPGVGRNSLARERAMGYLDGVMDAAAGKDWCPAGKKVPHEMNYAVIESLARLSPDQLDGDAATLVRAALAASYPCNPSGGKR